MTADEQKQFCVTGRLASVEDDLERICEDDEDLVLVDECRGSDSGGESDPLSDHNNNSKLAGYQAFDSHFHLDRTSTKLWGRFRDHTVEDLLDYHRHHVIDPTSISTWLEGYLSTVSRQATQRSHLFPDVGGPL